MESYSEASKLQTIFKEWPWLTEACTLPGVDPFWCFFLNISSAASPSCSPAPCASTGQSLRFPPIDAPVTYHTDLGTHWKSAPFIICQKGSSSRRPWSSASGVSKGHKYWESLEMVLFTIQTYPCSLHYSCFWILFRRASFPSIRCTEPIISHLSEKEGEASGLT